MDIIRKVGTGRSFDMSSLIDMMEQVKSLKNGVGIQSLLDESYKILGNPIVMFDTDYKLLFHNEDITDDPLWNEIITYGRFCKETQEFFKNEGFIEDVANAKGITFMTSGKLKYDRFTGKVFNKNHTHVANLVVIESDKPFQPHDPVVFEAICNLITGEISQSEFYQTYETMYQETLIKNLIDGNLADRELYTAHVAIIYDSLKANLYLAVVDISQCDSDYTKLAYFRDLFKQTQADYQYIIYSNYILIIISTDYRSLSIDKELTELNKLFEHNNIYTGISSRFENLFELPKHYAEAVNALNNGLKSKDRYDNERIFQYSE